MTITRVTVWAVDLPLARPYSLSGGRLRFERLDSTIVRIDTGTRLQATVDTDALGDPVAVHEEPT